MNIKVRDFMLNGLNLSKKLFVMLFFLQTCIKLTKNCRWCFCLCCLSSIFAKSRKFGQSWFKRLQTCFKLSTQSNFEKKSTIFCLLYHVVNANPQIYENKSIWNIFVKELLKCLPHQCRKTFHQHTHGQMLVTMSTTKYQVSPSKETCGGTGISTTCQHVFQSKQEALVSETTLKIGLQKMKERPYKAMIRPIL